MKISKTTYLSLFFLFCFTASFSANTLQNLRTSIHKSDLAQNKSASVSNKEENTDSGTNLLLEKSENETEKSLCIQSFILPFYISSFQFEVSQPLVLFVHPLEKQLTNPIYIAVRNFRV